VNVSIEQVAADVVRPLRQAVLRPHQTPAEQVWPGDDALEAAHFAARDRAAGDAVLGIASITPEPHPHDPRPGDWRVRGMATAPEARGLGLGARLLAVCVAHARTSGAHRVWCTARSPVVGFYTRAGFVPEGNEFTIPSIGPHRLMTLEISVPPTQGTCPHPTDGRAEEI
jgi:GNAT superfamily N-acetyltransferase